jgi:uncharacterized protein (TIGR03084 family)
MADLFSLCDDLEAECAQLDDLVAPLDGVQWHLATPAPGWDIRTQIGHLYFADDRAVLAATDPERFESLKVGELADDRAVLDSNMLGREAGPSGAETLASWRDGRARFQAAFRALDPAVRVPWYGPAMSPLSMVTARIMETWAHGQDVADALATTIPATNRLRHVAHIGVGARRWSYTLRRLEMPDEGVFVELRSPFGEIWAWGDPKAPNAVRGTALDFCLVTTQRRHLDDTSLERTGAAAEEWMRIAQAYAGVAGAGRPASG